MWELDHKEGWAPKNWCFKLCCWRRLLRVPWTERRSNQSILKEINPDYSLGGLMLKLKLQYFGHMMWSADLLEKTLMLGKTEGKKRSGWQRMRRLDSTTSSTDMNLSKLQETAEDKGAWHATVHGFQRVGHDLVTEQLQQSNNNTSLTAQKLRPDSTLILNYCVALGQSTESPWTSFLHMKNWRSNS